MLTLVGRSDVTQEMHLVCDRQLQEIKGKAVIIVNTGAVTTAMGWVDESGL